MTRVGTQGRQEAAQWVTEYKISYSLDGGFYHFFKQSGYDTERVSLEEKYLFGSLETLKIYRLLFANL